MKKILIATIAAVAMSGAASAADMSMPLKARPAPAPAYSWTGCYLDAGGGYGMTNLSHNYQPLGVPTFPEITSGGRGYYGTVGGGCDYQFPIGGLGNFVVGVLGGYDFMSLKGAFGASWTTQSGYEKESGSGYVGGRIGYLVTPNLLTYVSGGWTDARFSSFNFTSAPIFGLPAHTYNNGYFLGGGAETSLSPWLPAGFFLRTDYKVSTYSAASLPYFAAATGVPTGNFENIKPYVQQIGTELIYRFNYH
jgi:outer membrane immunogenic protein